MDTTLGQTSLPVVAAAGLGGPVLVAIGGVVVVLAILLVFIMVLRNNGGARKTASGMGFDAQQGPLGQPRAPMSQPNAGRGRGGPPAGGPRQPGWSPDGNDFGTGETYDGAWGAPAGAGRGQDVWGAPPQPQQPQFGGAPAGWGEEPAWGPTPGIPGTGTAQNGWDAPQGAPMPGSPDSWGQPAPQPGWGAPPTAPRSWGAPGGAPAGSPLGGPAAPASGTGWGAPPVAAPGAAPDWNLPAAPAGGFQVDKTQVVRPAGATRLATLVVRQGKEPGRVYELRKERTTIGRSRESDIFLEDLAVSRLHSTINRDDGGRYYLRDENSANGTLLNGQRVSEQELQEGDEVQVGQTVLAFVHR